MGYWYVDGEEVASGPLTLGSGPATLVYRYDYYYGMPETSTVSYRLTYTTQDGRAQEVTGGLSADPWKISRITGIARRQPHSQALPSWRRERHWR